jgi:prepilin-type N-terminal cleavage/methylation domain-containing protein
VNAIRVAGTRRDDAGLTLIELLVVVALLGLIGTTLGMAIQVGLLNFGGASTRVSNSTDAQIVSLYFPADVQSTGNSTSPADLVVNPSNTTSTPGGNFATDAGNAECSGQPNLFRLRWDTAGIAALPAAEKHTFLAAYVLAQQEGRWLLTRHFCVDGGGPKSTVVARNLNGNTVDDAKITVSGDDNRQIELQLKGKVLGPAEPSGYTWTIKGFRRAAP